MACTLLRIVQAAVNLRRRFECAIQSSFESVESGDAGEEREDKATAEENGQTQPDEKDMNTSEQLSQNFQLSFTEPDEEIENIGEPFQAATEDISTPKMTFIHAEDKQDAEDIENGAYKDAVASSSIEIIEENGRASATKESGNEAQTKESDSSSVETENTWPTKDSTPVGAVQKIPMVQVNEISGSERSSDSDSDSRCSVKSVRLRYAEAVSPSSGCKPAKLIRSDALETSAERESNNLQWILLVKESGSELVKETERENGDSTTESEIDKNELVGYSEWLLKGRSCEAGSSSDENDASLTSPELYDDNDDDDSEHYLEDDDEVMVDESFDDSFVDDGFVSLELDEYDDDVIIEEDEEDLERERMEEEMMEEMRRYMMEG